MLSRCSVLSKRYLERYKNVLIDENQKNRRSSTTDTSIVLLFYNITKMHSLLPSRKKVSPWLWLTQTERYSNKQSQSRIHKKLFGHAEHRDKKKHEFVFLVFLPKQTLCIRFEHFNTVGTTSSHFSIFISNDKSPDRKYHKWKFTYMMNQW